ncbi:MAG: hypothetical protein Q8898_04225 [Bacillota bacterium]|nr:hypothetical protein [Bacillota bacterium]
MPYVIDKANILNNNKLSQRSILIKDNRIDSIQPEVKNCSYIKMDVHPYVMTPSFVVSDTNFSLSKSYSDLKNYFTEHLIKKGCTILLTYIHISSEGEMMTKLKEMKKQLLNSPIDYLIAIKIPLKLLTPSFITTCKQKRFPAIFVELADLDELSSKAWSWIRQAMFPSKIPIIPCLAGESKKKRDALAANWEEIVKNEKINGILGEIQENIPLSRDIVNKIGLLPQRAGLMHGGELSYNLYLNGSEIMNVDTESLFHYHRDRLMVTVHKGKVVRSGNEVFYMPGFGEHITIQTSSYFSF